MNSLPLNKRVTVERLEPTTDPDYGCMVEAWIPTHSVWAAIETLTGREFVIAMTAQAEVTIQVRIRYLPGITSAMRITYQGRIFNIQSVINPNEANRELVLMCLEHIG